MNVQKWGTNELASDKEIIDLHIGDLQLWIQRNDDEIWIGNQYQSVSEPESKKENQPPEDLTWSRWAPRNTVSTVNILPVFPDLPLVINSDYPLRVIRGASINIFTRIPIWVQVSMDNHAVLAEFPTVKLSRTWFGNPMDGELCYWATTKARRSLQNVEAKSHLVNCPIQITNKTEENLNFEKFCFRVERLKVFRYRNVLWADKSHISYEGEEQHSNIIMSGKLPEGMEEAELLSAPRKPIQKSLATRTFHKIFDTSFIFGH